MINRSIQCFVKDTYGPTVWAAVVREAKFDFDNFEAMLSYPDNMTLDVLNASARHLSKPLDVLLEDIGTYLVSHPNVESLRRLLRFGGDDFVDFMFSLNELEGRTRLALPDLEAPIVSAYENSDGSHTLTCSHSVPGLGHALVGVMRAMADDYGALVFLEHTGVNDCGESIIKVQLLEAAFTEGKSFDLSARAV